VTVGLVSASVVTNATTSVVFSSISGVAVEVKTGALSFVSLIVTVIV